MKRVACYIRVSTNQQTTENQRMELEAYCKRQDWTITKYYDDSGFSGSSNDRPALNEMLQDIRNGKTGIDIICCWKIDRLARSTAHLLALLTELKNAGIDFVSTTQAIDTSTSYGKMVMTFLGAISEFERDTIIERVKAGMSRAKSQGIRIGRPKTTFDIPHALQLKRQGCSWAKVSVAVNTSVATLRRTITPLLKTPEKLVA